MLDSRDETIYHYMKGENERECIRKIEENFGHGSFSILGRRNVKLHYGFLNLQTKDGIELTYTLHRSQGINPMRGDLYTPPYIQTGMSSQNFEIEKNKILENSGKRYDVRFDELSAQIKQLQSVIQDTNTGTASQHETFTRIENLLEENEFPNSFIKKMTDRIRKEFSLGDLDDFNKIQDAVVEWIGESVNVDVPVYTSRPQIIILVGPTGVGKTTTIAKLAHRFAFGGTENEKRKNVNIFTADYYRIAGKEQIQIYGEVMSIPVTFIDINRNLIKNIEQCKNTVDYIIIDTPGYSPKDFENLEKLRNVLALENYSVETYLCMSAATKLSDMRDIMLQYEIFNYKSVIITKFDETNHIGNIVCALNEKNKSIVHFTTGQSVPRYIENASVLRMLMELSGFKINRAALEEKFGPMAPINR